MLLSPSAGGAPVLPRAAPPVLPGPSPTEKACHVRTDGRWPHIHFEVFESAEAAVSGEASVLTAQIARPEAECPEVYTADPRYSNSTRNLGRITLASDNVFTDNTKAQIAQQTLALSGDPWRGYAGRLTIPVDFTADRSTGMGPPPATAGERRQGTTEIPPMRFDDQAAPFSPLTRGCAAGPAKASR